MKSATSVIALVAAIAPFTLAVPFHYERDYVVTNTAVVTEFKQVTAYVTEGAQTAAPASSSSAADAAASSSQDYDSQRWSHRSHSHAAASSSSSSSASSASPLSTSVVPAPPTTSSTSSTSSSSTSSSSTSSSSTSSSSTSSSSTSSSSTSAATSSAPAPTTAPATSTSSPATSASASWTSENVPQITGDAAYTDENMKAIMVPVHNNYRHKFQAPPVTWNDTSVQSLKAFFADASLNPCGGEHYGSGIGQNVADGYTPQGAVDGWMDEYNPSDVVNSGGHFTQVVWVASITIGCAAINCPAYGWHTYCNYYPQGNFAMAGQNSYADNIKPAIS